MSNFENILQFSHFSIALDMSRIPHFLAEIMNPKNSASGNLLFFYMSGPKLSSLSWVEIELRLNLACIWTLQLKYLKSSIKVFEVLFHFTLGYLYQDGLMGVSAKL